MSAAGATPRRVCAYLTSTGLVPVEVVQHTEAMWRDVWSDGGHDYASLAQRLMRPFLTDNTRSLLSETYTGGGIEASGNGGPSSGHITRLTCLRDFGPSIT
jgi:hypothetical protein